MGSRQSPAKISQLYPNKNLKVQNQKKVSVVVKNPPHLPVQERQETRVQSLGREDPLEEAMATDSSILTWKILWTEEPSRLQSMVLQSQT